MPPPPVEGVEDVCRDLLAALPEQLDPGVERREVEPETGRTAAWGDPPVTLECGVEPPERAEPPFVVNGVELTTRDVGSATRWTTYGRTVFVALTIPDDYSGAEVVVTLADALGETLPDDPDVGSVLEETPQ